MSRPVRYSSLTPARRRLVALVRQLQFGRIENLVIAGGDPDWSESPRVVCEEKLGAAAVPVSPAADDFELKAQWADLFRRFDLMAEGVVERLDVQNALPFRVAYTVSSA